MKKPCVQRGGEVRELDADFFAKTRRGRPALPDGVRKRRVNVMLDPDIADRLKEIPNASAFVNTLLRKKFLA